MNLDDDLARWEAGYLSREELIASYASSEKNLAEPFEKNLERNFEKNLERNLDKNLVPERALVQMLDLHERLVDIGSEPVPYQESDWEQLRDSLPDRLPTRRVFGTGRLARPFIAASMVVGLTAGAAAASPTVREHMVSIWHGIQHNIGLVDDPSPVEDRSPISVSPHAPGDQVGGGTVGITGPGNSANPRNGDGNGGGNSDGNPGNGGGNSGGPGNSDGTPGGGNTEAPGNSDGTPGGGNSGEGGGNSGSGGGSDEGDGNSGEGPGNSDGTPGGGNSGEGGNSGSGGGSDEGDGNGGGNSGGSDSGEGGGNFGEGGPGNSDGTPGGGNSGS